jgi:hypothetical protein
VQRTRFMLGSAASAGAVLIGAKADAHLRKFSPKPSMVCAPSVCLPPGGGGGSGDLVTSLYQGRSHTSGSYLSSPHYGTLNSGSSAYQGSTSNSDSPSGLTVNHSASFPSIQRTVSGTVYYPGSVSASAPTQIATSASGLAVFTDPNNNGAYASFRSPSGQAYNLSLYPYGSNGNQAILTISGPNGTSSTVYNWPSSIAFAHNHVEEVAYDPHNLFDVGLDNQVAFVRCCNCTGLLAYALGGIALIFFALSGLGLIVEIGALGGAAAVAGGGVGAVGFLVETVGRLMRCG